MRNIEQCFPLQKPSIEDIVKINQIKNYLISVYIISEVCIDHLCNAGDCWIVLFVDVSYIAQWYLKLPKRMVIRNAINEGDSKYSPNDSNLNNQIQTLDDCLKCNPVYPNIIYGLCIE